MKNTLVRFLKGRGRPWSARTQTLASGVSGAAASFLHNITGGSGTPAQPAQEGGQRGGYAPAPKSILQTGPACLGSRQREMAFLCELGQLLQGCRTVEEVCNVARSRLQRLSPDLSGALYLMNPAGHYLETVMAWGSIPGAEGYFPPDECWALRCGKPHQIGTDESDIVCGHMVPGGGAWHLCLPLMAQGEALGSLYFCVTSDAAGRNGAHELTSEESVYFYMSVAESVALAVANIRLRETLHEQAIRDSLTGLFNRRYLTETLRRELHRMARADLPLSVVMLDIDHFKQFNDTFGHDAGDAVLRTVGTILQNRTRAGDVACRYGGEEFALVFPGMPAETAMRRVEMLRHEVATREIYHLGQPLDQLTLSAGLSIYPRHAMDMDSLLHAADQALYSSKLAGRNRVTMAALPRRRTDTPPSRLELVHANAETGDDAAADGTDGTGNTAGRPG